MSEPEGPAPRCCGQLAKWVEVTVNLQYWYCEVCKTEVIDWGIHMENFPGVDFSPVKNRYLVKWTDREVLLELYDDKRKASV